MSFVRLAPEQFDTIPGIPEPSENPVLAGHEDAAAQVLEAYRAGRMHHAMLVSGPPGIGKATFAFHVARHLIANPKAENSAPALASADTDSALFRQVAQGSHPSVLHLTRPLNEKTKGFKSVVTIDEVRRVSRFLSMTSHDGGWRVVIVDPADDMNLNAANALLKNLEEPPSRTLFFLIAHAPGSLLPTIRSRCHAIKLRPLEPAVLIEVMSQIGAQVPDAPDQRAALAARAGGSVREALLLTEYGGLDIADAVTAVANASTFPVADAWRVAEAVGGRDGTIQFSIFNQTVLDMIAVSARQAAVSDDLATASRLSELWRDAERQIAETDTYNLDKKQHVSGLLRRLWQASAS